MQDPAAPAAVVGPVADQHGVAQAQVQVAQPQVKRRRMSVKGPDPLQQVIAPQVAAVLPIGGCWSNQTEESFNRLTNRQKYRYVHDRFFRWFGDKDLQYVRHDASTCSNELWQLARANLDGPSELQRRTVVRHFWL